MPEIEAFDASELAPNEIRQVEVDGHAPIAVYNLDGEFFATADTCTHGEASLSEGDIEGDEIMCPFHMGSFDIRTGEARIPPCVQPIGTYPVRVHDGKVYVRVEE